MLNSVIEILIQLIHREYFLTHLHFEIRVSLFYFIIFVFNCLVVFVCL